MMTETNIVRTQNSALEMQANLLGFILLMPLPQVKRCFYQLQSGRDRQQLVADMAGIFQVSSKPCVSGWRIIICCEKIFRKMFSKKRTEKARRHGTRNTQDPSLSHLREGTDRRCPSGGGLSQYRLFAMVGDEPADIIAKCPRCGMQVGITVRHRTEPPIIVPTLCRDTAWA